jgi:HEAT repeat protein
MNKLSLLLQEEDTDIQLAELGTEILRELFMAAKKLAVYQPDHPQALRAIERPHLLFRKWFAFSTVADLWRDGSLAYFGGVEMPRGPFTDGLVRDLDALQLKRVVFLPHLTEQDLLTFLVRLQERVPLARVESFMWNHLEKRGITSIRVNDPAWEEKLAGQRRFRTEDAAELSVARLVEAQCGDRTDLVAAVASGQVPDAAVLRDRYNCYFTPAILKQVLPERFAGIAADELIQLVSEELAGDRSELTSLLESSSRLDYLRHLLGAFSRHPRRRELMEAVRQLFHRQGLPEAAYEVLDARSRVQLEAMGEVDALTARIFSTACTPENLQGYGTAFARLLKCGYSEKPRSVLAALLLHLKRDDRDARRKAQFLLGKALAAAAVTQSWNLVGWLARRMADDVTRGEETFEFSDLLGGAGEQLILAGRYDLLAEAAGALRAAVSGAATPADQMVAQAVLTRWSEPRQVSVLMRVLAEGEAASQGHAVACLAAIGGPEVARQAALRVTHGSRRVRLTMLKLLSELGADARDTCIDLLSPAELWVRPEETENLPDQAWYTVRNALHILGRLGDPGALPVLKEHMNDLDSRVRCEVVRVLEKIGGEAALRLLVSLAADAEREVRHAAIVALGAAGGEHEVFILRELFDSHADSVDKIIYAIGHIGGEQAKVFLFNLLDSDALLKQAGYGHRITELREAVLKALAQNPDSEIIRRIEAYCRANDRTFRIPFATDKLTDTARISLERARLRVRNSA